MYNLCLQYLYSLDSEFILQYQSTKSREIDLRLVGNNWSSSRSICALAFSQNVPWHQTLESLYTSGKCPEVSLNGLGMTTQSRLLLLHLAFSDRFVRQAPSRIICLQWARWWSFFMMLFNPQRRRRGGPSSRAPDKLAPVAISVTHRPLSMFRDRCKSLLRSIFTLHSTYTHLEVNKCFMALQQWSGALVLQVCTEPTVQGNHFHAMR